MQNKPLQEIILPETFEITEEDMDQITGSVTYTNNAFVYALNKKLQLDPDSYLISTGRDALWYSGLSIVAYFSMETVLEYNDIIDSRWVRYIYLPFTKELYWKMQKLYKKDRSVVPFEVQLYDSIRKNKKLVTNPVNSVYGVKQN